MSSDAALNTIIGRTTLL